MSASRDIPRAWARPRAVMAEHMARGVGEDTAFVFLMVGCALVFVAQLPRLSREAFETGGDFMFLMGGTLMAWLFVAPLVFYALAALAHLVARAMGGGGTWLSARVATFWALLAAAPAWLLHGLVAGFIGPGPQHQVVGFIALAGFLWIWLNSLSVAEARHA